MGLAGILLKKREFVNVWKIVNDLEASALQAGLAFRKGIDYEETEDESFHYLSANIADTFAEAECQQQMLMYIYDISEDDSLQEFDWIEKGKNLIQIVNIEDFRGCEKILLDFLYEYLKRNPEDYFWNEREWYYTFDDITRMKRNEFDPAWCYKNPRKNLV
ncbi:MAG: hypothetical protein NC094_00310 [Bacteroidales bacterium]|nr:hypothetical protein [Lachnoclostridium sp.]MCM1384626.1 hypothetical protein [Lachnoclostridium sp.]MCM1463835.1 hypothetical protein [Bacteroidales bacterium]